MTLSRALAPPLLLAALAAVYLITAGGHLYSPDEELMYRVTDSLARRGRIDVPPMELGFGSAAGRDGRQYAQYGLGNSVAAIPLYHLGPMVLRLLPGDTLAQVLATGTIVNARRYAQPTPLDYARRFAVAHTNVLVTLLQVWVIYLFALALTAHVPGAVMTALMYGLATQAWPHAKTFFSEPLATLSLTGGAYLLWTGFVRDSVTRLWFAGVLFGWAVITRLDSVVALPGMALLFYAKGLSSNPEEAAGETDVQLGEETVEADVPPADLPSRVTLLSAHIAVGLPLLLAAAVVLGLNVLKFGSPFSTGYEDQSEGFQFSTPLREGLLGYLISPGRSLLLHSPPVALGLIGFPVLFRRAPALAAGLLVSIIGVLVFHAKWQNWSGGWDWGPRHVFALIALSAVPLGALLSARASALTRVAAVVVLFVGLGVQLLAISQNPIEFYEVFYRPHVEEGQTVPPAYYTVARLEGVPEPTGEDSVWTVRWSAWDGYPRLWNQGVHDLFWLRWWQWRRGSGGEAGVP